ncbi:hypothetical protein [Arsenophonus apicola]
MFTNTLVRSFTSATCSALYGGSGRGAERLAGVSAGLQTLSGSPPKEKG